MRHVLRHQVVDQGYRILPCHHGSLIEKAAQTLLHILELPTVAQHEEVRDRQGEEEGHDGHRIRLVRDSVQGLHQHREQCREQNSLYHVEDRREQHGGAQLQGGLKA